VLQEQQFQRVGSNEVVRTGARILAATNKDLDAEVAAGRFRKDLYYRLKVVTIRVPALRERPEDVAELAHYFLFRFNRDLSLDLRGLAPAALEALRTYRWPGNVRELMSAIKQAMLQASGPVLLAEFLPAEFRSAAPAAMPEEGRPLDLDAAIESALRNAPGRAYQAVLDAVDRALLSRALRETHGHQAKASELLGLNRTTLRTRLRALGMSVDKVVVEGDGDSRGTASSTG
jgi:two-component system, NtrC family, nitrogen regulation response regulator GlnG